MRILEIVAVCAALGGCAAPGQEVASTSRLGDQFVGKNVNSLVPQFGKPISRNKMDNDQTTYVWELDAATDSAADRRIDTGHAGLYGDGHTPGYMSDDPRRCKMSVAVSPEGIITQIVTEEQNGTGAPTRTFGILGGVCAQLIGTKSRT
jgi:hypothetical protein